MKEQLRHTWLKSRVREIRKHGSVRGAISNGRLYRVNILMELYGL
jgi:hypothetical protein